MFFLRKLLFLSIISIRKGGRFVLKQGQPQPHFHSKARITVKRSILFFYFDVVHKVINEFNLLIYLSIDDVCLVFFRFLRLFWGGHLDSFDGVIRPGSVCICC